MLSALRRAAIGAAALALGCSGNAASQLAKAPGFNPDNQTKCSVQKSQAKPLIVEWPSSERLALEAQIKRGVVAVRYSGCEMEVLNDCRAPGAYGYTPTTRQDDLVTIRNADELYASIPIYAARFEGNLHSAGQLNVSMSMVGTYQADRQRVTRADLSGDCEHATHIVAALTAGAFEFFSGADAAVGGGATAGGVGAGARSTSEREMLNRGGDARACDKATGDDARPPFGCGALLRVQVVEIAEGAVASPVAAPGPPINAPASAPASAPAAAPGPKGPVQDHDGDGIVDAEDACPDVPGVRDPNPRLNGCPAEPAASPPSKKKGVKLKDLKDPWSK